MIDLSRTPRLALLPLIAALALAAGCAPRKPVTATRAASKP